MKWIVQLLAVILAMCLSGCITVIVPPNNTLPTGQFSTTEPSTPPAATQTTPPEETLHPESQPTETAPPETQPAPTEPEDDAFVRVCDYIPTIYIELVYATEMNFTGQKIYEFTEPWLRYGTVKKLMQVQEELQAQKLYLKIWDAFRPTAAQWKLWDIYPDPTYVSNPVNGFNSHCRGNAVDITLVDANGQELTMPTGFDDFSKLADRDYSDCPQEAANNALLLEQVMKKYGFTPYAGEWWHFADSDSYPVDKDFLPVTQMQYYADCNEYINLRTAPSSKSEAITQIPVNERFLVLAWHGDFALVDYQGLRGYVLSAYINQVPIAQ